MSWSEFCALLAGIMPKTPLGQVVSIRSEENNDILKNFTSEQHRIRDEWRSRAYEENQKAVADMTEEEKTAEIKKIQEIFAKAFS